ncbi:hypothetical protein GQX73_g2047 [Xylaria multiplex]|uniref:Heterokaryon incompatibility domain-containing protein n=1 Tax=Xylaria multiplex TaxID=323545 RepID=A0A7C8ISV6_9PEZI|nr:hypothetical protein GQX73_g2047 [Xylaria multiplex]
MQPFFGPNEEDNSEWEDSLPSEDIEHLWKFREWFQNLGGYGYASRSRGRVPGWAHMVTAHAQALDTGTATDHLPMSRRKAGKYAFAARLNEMKNDQPEMYMQLLQESKDPFSDVSSFSETEMTYGWHIPPWRDSDFFNNIPDLFTVDLDGLTREEEECSCPRFTEDEEDFRFFPSRGFQWNPSKGREPVQTGSDSDSLIFSEGVSADESKTTCRYESGLVVCVGRDEPLDDPSSVNFSPGVGAVSADYSNDETWHRAKECLRLCRDEHDRCRHRDGSAQASGFKPTRLIDIGQDDNGPPRLVRSESLLKDDVKSGYVTLSYCWGRDIEQKTTTQNIETRFDQGLPLKSQPMTIQDAITATRKMGFRYLWIDSICIVQDDDNDVLTEMAHMDKIYEHADLLISASRSASANGGFLQPIAPEEVEKTEIELSIPFKYRYQGETGRVVLEKWFESRADLTPEPIHSRAWTLQEHLLSKRILSFNTTGLSWQCLRDSMFGAWKKSAYTDKTQVLSSPSNMICRNTVLVIDEKGHNVARRSNPYKYETVREEWDELLNNFCLRSLTKQSDRLSAFSAIPKQFMYAFGPAEDYVAGHWKCHLPIDLLWQSRDFVQDRHGLFPTWSWAGCRYSADETSYRGLEIPFFEERYMTAVMSVKEIDVDLVNPSDHFGDVRYARLLVTGPLVPVNLTFECQENKGGGEFFMEIEGAEYGVEDALWLRDGDNKPQFWGQLDGYYRRLDKERLTRRLTGKGGGHYLAEILRESDRHGHGSPMSRGLILRRSGHRDGQGRKRFKRFGTYQMFHWKDDEEYYEDEFLSVVSGEEREEEEGGEEKGDDEDEEEKGVDEDEEEDALAIGSDTSRVSAGLHEDKRACYPFDAVKVKRFWLI